MEQQREPAQQAIGRLYEQHYQPILRYLYRLCGNYTVAEDLAQETFLKALRHWDKLTAIDAPVVWLFRIARNTAFDEYRRQRRSRGVPLTDVHAKTVADEHAESIIEDVEPIRAALDHLPDQYQRVLLLHNYAGYPIQTIAADLGWKEGTVKSRLSRARAQFRRHYLA